MNEYGISLEELRQEWDDAMAQLHFNKLRSLHENVDDALRSFQFYKLIRNLSLYGLGAEVVLLFVVAVFLGDDGAWLGIPILISFPLTMLLWAWIFFTNHDPDGNVPLRKYRQAVRTLRNYREDLSNRRPR